MVRKVSANPLVTVTTRVPEAMCDRRCICNPRGEPIDLTQADHCGWYT